MALIEVIFDLPQYDLALTPVVQELLHRHEHPLMMSRTYPSGRSAGASIGVQDAGANRAPHPHFHITHGLSCLKGWGLKFLQTRDVFLAPTLYWAKRDLERQGVVPGYGEHRVNITNGWPRMDLWSLELNTQAAVQPGKPGSRDYNRDAWAARLGVSSRGPLIAYAPTWDKGDRRTRPWTWSAVANVLGPVGNVVVLGHQLEKTEDRESKDIRVFGGYGDDRLALLCASDLLVTDRSGLAFEWLITGRPIVLLDSGTPGHLHLEGAVDNEPVDIGPHVGLTRLRETVEHELADDQYRDRRQAWRERIVGPCDGLHAARTVDVINSILQEPQS